MCFSHYNGRSSSFLGGAFWDFAFPCFQNFFSHASQQNRVRWSLPPIAETSFPQYAQTESTGGYQARRVPRYAMPHVLWQYFWTTDFGTYSFPQFKHRLVAAPAKFSSFRASINKPPPVLSTLTRCSRSKFLSKRIKIFVKFPGNISRKRG